MRAQCKARRCRAWQAAKLFRLGGFQRFPCFGPLQHDIDTALGGKMGAYGNLFG